MRYLNSAHCAPVFFVNLLRASTTEQASVYFGVLMMSVPTSSVQLDSLPGDVVTRIAHHLRGEFVAALQMCNKSLYEGVELTWESVYKQRWCCLLEVG